jgi:hypothetical protein
MHARGYTKPHTCNPCGNPDTSEGIHKEHAEGSVHLNKLPHEISLIHHVEHLACSMNISAESRDVVTVIDVVELGQYAVPWYGK